MHDLCALWTCSGLLLARPTLQSQVVSVALVAPEVAAVAEEQVQAVPALEEKVVPPAAVASAVMPT